MLSHCLNQMVWVTKEYDRTKRYYTRKAGKGVIAVLKDNTTRGKPLVPPTLFLRCGAPPDLQWWRLWWRQGGRDADGGTCPMLLGFRHLGEASPNTFHRGRWQLLRYIPCLTNYRLTDAKRNCLTSLWKRWTSKVLTSIQERHRSFADKAFHRLHNKLAHSTRFAIRRKIHNAKQQRNYKDTKPKNFWKSGQTIFGRLWQDEF